MTTQAQVPTCQRTGCERPLTGRQQKWCCETCKVLAWYESRVSGKTAEEMLAALPQDELRKVIRRVMERRHPGKRDRLRVRWGGPGDEPLKPGVVC